MKSIKKKRVLILTPFFSPNLGGVETHLDDLCNYLTSRSYFVYVLTYQPLATPVKGKGLEKKKNLEIRRFNWPGYNLFDKLEKLPPIFNFLYLTPYLFLRTLIFLLTHYREIDVIHAFGLNAAFVARFMKIIFGKRIVMSTEALYGYQKGTVFTNISVWVLKGFNKILAQSEVSKDEMVKIGVPAEKIDVFSHWVNRRRFKSGSKVEFKKQLGWEDKFTVLYVGRLIPQKGIDVFLKVVEKTKEQINFKIIGNDGLKLPKVKKAEKKFKNLDYIGRVSYGDLPPYYAAADVFVYPALYEEDMSRAILEALSCGTPVISTNRGSGIYTLVPEVAFVTRADAEKIRQKINFLSRYPQKHRQMVKNCRRFSKKFGPILARKITEAY